LVFNNISNDMRIAIGAGIGYSSNNYNKGGDLFILDKFTGAEAAYSLRKLSKDTTNVVRVRRDSDNAEQDFTAAEVSDGTLASWVGVGNDGLVTTWYDQSGNNKDALQTVAASQPKIVSSGVVILTNGKPCVSPDGVDDLLGDTLSNITYNSIFAVGLPATNVTNNTLLDIDGYLGWEQDKVIYRTNAFSPHTFPSDTTQGLISVIAQGNSDPRSVVAYRNGVASTSNPINLNLGNEFIRIFGASSTGEYDSPIQEIIIYPFDQSANRTGVEQDINDYYSIY